MLLKGITFSQGTWGRSSLDWELACGGEGYRSTVCGCGETLEAPNPWNRVVWHHRTQQDQLILAKQLFFMAVSRTFSPFLTQVPDWRARDAIPPQRLGWVDQGNDLYSSTAQLDIPIWFPLSSLIVILMIWSYDRGDDKDKSWKSTCIFFE